MTSSSITSAWTASMVPPMVRASSPWMSGELL